MPWKSFKQGNKYCVYKLDEDGEKTGPTLGCHPTKEAADKQVAALEINVSEIMENMPKKKKKWASAAENT